MPPAIIITVYGLAVARITRLITADRVFERPRAALSAALWTRALRRGWMARSPEDAPLSAYLLSCPWCVSIWVGVVAAVMMWWAGDSPWLLVPAVGLAFSQLTGLMARGE